MPVHYQVLLIFDRTDNIELQRSACHMIHGKKISKKHVFLNRSGEHIAGYMIHLYKNKTK